MQPSWGEHLDMVQIVIGALCAIIAWAAKAWLDSQTKINRGIIDEQKNLHGRITDVDNRLHKLEGKHESVMNHGRP